MDKRRVLAAALFLALLMMAAGCADRPSESAKPGEDSPQKQEAAPNQPAGEEPSQEGETDPNGPAKEAERKSAEEADDMVRVAIALDKPSVAEAGYRVNNIANDPAAQAYRAELERYQAEITRRIEALTGEPLDVVWNITLTANVISANVRLSDMERIRTVEGVASVEQETLNEPTSPGTAGI